MTYKVIATGSSGNAVLINGCVLIDCGVGIKALREVEHGIKLVLLTHIHGDHFKPSTVKALARQHPALRWGCCDWMVDPLIKAGVNPRCIDVYDIKGNQYCYVSLGIAVEPVKLTHNVPNCGYHIELEDGKKVFYATDTGSLEDIEAKGYDLYLLEANHGEEEIQERIRVKQERGESFIYETSAAINHLSCEKALAWLDINMGDNSTWVRLHEHREAPS